MVFTVTFFLTGGLFDFDLTFLLEALLFLILSIVVTYIFIIPVSNQLEERSEYIDKNLRKSSALITYGYTQVNKSVDLLTEELAELNRQVKLTKGYTNSIFEIEVSAAQKSNSLIMSELKGELAIKSAFLFLTVVEELKSTTEKFFTKKFQSIS